MNWKSPVIFLAIITYLYILATEWIDLSPWNDVTRSTSSQKLSGSLANLLPMALLAIAFLFDVNWLKLLSIGLLVAWLAIHFVWWWIPYFSGASEAHLAQYARYFASTYKFLPHIGGNPIPTAQYVVMQVLTLITLVLALILVVTARGPRA